ncbi:MAG TPA: hypothetical protein VGQ83_20605 [Polyangia bacterium]|jgi:hypothetical protein
MSRVRLLIALPAAALLALWVGVRGCVELRPTPPLPAASRAAVMATLRAALDGAPAPAPAGPGLERAPAGPFFATAYRHGEPLLRCSARAATIGAAAAACGESLRAEATRRGLGADERRAARIKVDLTTAEGRLVTWPRPAFALGIVPGIDGVGVAVSGREERLLPDDLVRGDLLAGARPFAWIEEFHAGLHVPRLVAVLARRLELDGAAWRRADKRFFRFRTEAFIEPAAARGQALELARGAVAAAPAVDRATLRAAALAGGRYLVRAQRPDGSFDYLYETLHDAATDADYSLPRHFGATYFLAQLHGATGDAAASAAARRALAWGAARVPAACQGPDLACIVDRGDTVADLGTAALALVALLEHRRHTGDASHDALAHRLVALILRMQKPGGDFAHVFRLADRRPDPAPKYLYYDGEAALALARAYAAFGEPQVLAALRRALDYLTGAAYAHFAGQFFFGEDHWTCVAAEAAWPHLRDPRYERFCRQYGRFMRYSQFGPGEHPPDFAGAYGFTPFFPPHTTPAGSRTEAMISAYLLGRHHGRPDERIRRQCLLALSWLLRQQLTADNCYLCRDPARADGGFVQNPVSRHVRIDFIQHIGSAMLRMADLL